MITKIQLQKDAPVLTADGQPVGSLERVVVNPKTNVVTDIVVRTGGLFDREAKVVSLDLVAETTADQIALREEAGELKSMPLFEERRLVEAKGELDLPPQNVSPVIPGYPGLGSSDARSPGEKFVTQMEQNIPDGTVAMKEGARVITHEGKHVGNVERVIADPAVDQVTHLLISSGLLSKEQRLIPMKWVTALSEEEVHLRVKKDTVEKLAATPVAG